MKKTWNKNRVEQSDLPSLPTTPYTVTWVDQITFADNPTDIYQLPPEIAAEKDEIINYHKETADIYDAPLLKVSKVSKTGGLTTVTLGRTTYYNSLVTNRSLAYVLKSGKTVRETLLPEGVPTLENNPLSNHLAVTTIVELADGNIVFVVRGDKLSIARGGLGSVVAGSIKTKYSLENSLLKLFGVGDAIAGEVLDESGFEIKGGEAAEGLVKALYYDNIEGGKPNLYCELSLPVDKVEFTKRFEETMPEDSLSRDGTELVFKSREEVAETVLEEETVNFPDGSSYEVSSSTAISLEIFGVRRG